MGFREKGNTTPSTNLGTVLGTVLAALVASVRKAMHGCLKRVSAEQEDGAVGERK